jgi:hypothetical protein
VDDSSLDGLCERLAAEVVEYRCQEKLS